MPSVKSQLKSLVAESEYQLVAKLLIEIAQNSDDFFLSRKENDYFSQLNQANTYAKNKKLGTVSEANLNLAKNKLSNHLADMIDDLPNDVPSPPGLVKIMGGASAPSKLNETDQAAEAILRILMLQANPRGTVRLNLSQEHADIHAELSSKHQNFQLIPRQDVRITELNQEIIREKPQVVHFSGHGRSSTPSPPDPNDPFAEPQPGETGGLLLVNPRGDGLFPAPATALAFMFKGMVEQQEIPLKLVFLNACHSGEQAEAIAAHVPFVIGTSDEVLDDAAWAFSKSFYFSLADQVGAEFDESMIRKAFNAGQMNALFMGEPEDRFMLYINGALQ